MHTLIIPSPINAKRMETRPGTQAAAHGADVLLENSSQHMTYKGPIGGLRCGAEVGREGLEINGSAWLQTYMCKGVQMPPLA